MESRSTSQTSTERTSSGFRTRSSTTTPRDPGRRKRHIGCMRAIEMKQFDAVNDGFHATYDSLRQAVAKEVKVLVVLAEAVVLHRDGERTSEALLTRPFEIVRSTAHAPVVVFVSLHRAAGKPLSASSLSALARLHEHISGAARDLRAESSAFGPEAAADLGVVLSTCDSFLANVLEQRVTSRGALHAFARDLGSVLLRLADVATEIQLASLHRAVESLASRLTEGERENLRIVVTGDHQARDRNLAIQYFRERTAAWKDGEERITYAEGVADEQGALDLVATQILDRELAEGFFADPARLQRDVLGDAAKRRLAAEHLSPLAG